MQRVERQDDHPTESTPLIDNEASPASTSETGSSATFDPVGLRCLMVQHFSSAWNDRTSEFALYLYLIMHYKDTLLPASILGFSMTMTGVTLARWTGSLIDKFDNLGIVRAFIIVQKLSSIVAYTTAALILSPERLKIQNAWPSFVTPFFALLVISSCILHLSNIGVSIAVEREWATCIAKGPNSSERLSRLNTYLRQINLLCKLCAPLFVSILTIQVDTPGNIRSIWILSSISAFTLLFELYWIGVVYSRFPALRDAQMLKNLTRQQATQEEVVDTSSRQSPTPFTATTVETRPFSILFLSRQYLSRVLSTRDWSDLVHLPIFFSSLSISMLYLTVLSFDGIMVSYLKTIHFTDDFIAEMRGLCVVTGLLGTAIAAPLERKIGLVRAGNWSIWSMVFCLVPVIVSFYAFAPGLPSLGTGPSLGMSGAILLFGGMALSRIGLWSFDLIQTKQLQSALTSHPRRNTLTGLQYTMQNIADLMKYVLTMILHRPSQFRWAVLASFISVSVGALTYVVYVKKERGHVTHIPPIKLDWVKKII